MSAIVLSQDVVEPSSNLRLRSKDCLLEVHQLVPYCSGFFNYYDINTTLIYTIFDEMLKVPTYFVTLSSFKTLFNTIIRKLVTLVKVLLTTPILMWRQPVPSPFCKHPSWILKVC